jgi:anti-sigma factor RsiW
MDANSCPADRMETAEAYVMNRMDPSEESIYEEHLAQCDACTKAVEDTRAFVQAMRDAAREIVDDEDEKLK